MNKKARNEVRLIPCKERVQDKLCKSVILVKIVRWFIGQVSYLYIRKYKG